MAEDLMRYDLLAQAALRGVVRAALRKVAKDGLPGDHHFFIAFDTRYPGVRISERLDKKYQNEMTIVLQHQYWNLAVQDDEFAVELHFDNIPEKIVVPFNAIRGFLDPHVQFGLQFETVKIDAVDPEVEAAGRPKVLETVGAEEPAKAAADDPGRVISLDSFRKK